MSEFIALLLPGMYEINARDSRTHISGPVIKRLLMSVSWASNNLCLLRFPEAVELM